jgi:hypothetical protein
MPNETKLDRDQKRVLVTTWMKLAKAMLAALDAETPSASALDTVRRWLADQGADLRMVQDVLGQARLLNGLTLPIFTDEPDVDPEVAKAEADRQALSRPPPFPAK